MSKVESHVLGTPCWIDLMTPDPEKARAFYGELLGWSYVLGGADTGFYAIASRGGANAAGIGQMPPDSKFPSVWSVYFATDNADQAVAKVKEHGGSVMVEPMDVPPNQGRFTVCVDVTGGVFGYWQARSMKGTQFINEPGSFCWIDCMSREPEKALAFYEAVLDVKSKPMPGSPKAYYTLHKVEGDEPSSGLGMMDDHIPAFVPTHWRVFFAVDDITQATAKVKRMGGTVMSEPFDTPYGKMAPAADPFGAQFLMVQLPAKA